MASRRYSRQYEHVVEEENFAAFRETGIVCAFASDYLDKKGNERLFDADYEELVDVGLRCVERERISTICVGRISGTTWCLMPIYCRDSRSNGSPTTPCGAGLTMAGFRTNWLSKRISSVTKRKATHSFGLNSRYPK
jgi:hypothetical protein